MSARNCSVGGTAYFATPFGSAQTQLDEALLDPALETVIFAFFTNDSGLCVLASPPFSISSECTAEAIVDKAVAVYNSAVAAGVDAYIGTAPPRIGPAGIETLIAEINTDVYARFPASQIIDFTTGFTTDLCEDPWCVHWNVEGQWLRAARVVEALGLPDGDGDGVADEDDNCVAIANGPWASACSMQQDGDSDGYGVACDTDFDGDGVTSAVDLGVMLTAVAEVSTEVRFDLNCNGAADIVDQGVVLMDWRLGGVVPGPSGKACAGTVPCP